MFAFSRNNGKLREEIILIGFQVRPKGRTGYNSSNIQNLEFLHPNMQKWSMKTFLFGYWIRQGSEKRTVNLRKRLGILVPGGEVFSDKKGE